MRTLIFGKVAYQILHRSSEDLHPVGPVFSILRDEELFRELPVDPLIEVRLIRIVLLVNVVFVHQHVARPHHHWLRHRLDNVSLEPLQLTTQSAELKRVNFTDPHNFPKNGWPLTVPEYAPEGNENVPGLISRYACCLQ